MQVVTNHAAAQIRVLTGGNVARLGIDVPPDKIIWQWGLQKWKHAGQYPPEMVPETGFQSSSDDRALSRPAGIFEYSSAI
jgi:hypothetical protein